LIINDFFFKTIQKNLGGKLFIFQSVIPNYGPGAIRNREEPKLLGSDKERTLYEPQDDFYKKIGVELSTAGISVDLFLFPRQYVDVATLGMITYLFFSIHVNFKIK